MKKILITHERGQALVLIAFAAIGLFAFAALAIDGSMVFSDRRHAQNAADTAALDAALAFIRDPNATNPGLNVWVGEGLDRAESNGYDNDGTRNIVAVELCSTTADPCDSLPAGADPASFIQVQITSNVNTYFARVIGINQITNRVEAVAEVVPSTYDEMFYGNAVVGLAPTDCQAVKFNGNATTTITSTIPGNAGILVMSDCENTAFFNHSGAGSLTADSICAVGGIEAGGAVHVPSQTEGCIPPPAIVEPNPSCGSAVAMQSGNTMSEGTWVGQFPPAGVNTLLPGIYCVDGDFRINGGDSLTGFGVVIRMDSGSVTWNGGATVILKAPTSGTYDGLLIYMPSSTNCNSMTLNGNAAASEIIGTILAPCSNISILGTGDGGITGQLIGYTVDLSGTSDVTLHYDDAQNYDAPTHPQIKVND